MLQEGQIINFAVVFTEYKVDIGDWKQNKSFIFQIINITKIHGIIFDLYLIFGMIPKFNFIIFFFHLQ
jgi:hypothetical protein